MLLSTPSAARPARAAQLQILLVVAVFALPVIASCIAYYGFRPSRTMNYGELMTTAPVADPPLVTTAKRPFRLSGLRGKWVLLHVDAAACPETCERKLYTLRQVRLAVGRDQERVERVFLIDGPGMPPTRLASEYAGTHFVQAEGSALVRTLPATRSVRDHLYLIDPLGNLVLRYPPSPDPRRMLKDLERLLKVSTIG
jgi:cytochrome oxidase Cu insertion factor (SCO1/SenC/PrrC family)